MTDEYGFPLRWHQELLANPTHPVRRFLNEVSAAETQKDVADLLARHRDLVQGLPRDARQYVLRHVTQMADQLPEVLPDLS
jgi:hypothetical protein